MRNNELCALEFSQARTVYLGYVGKDRIKVGAGETGYFAKIRECIGSI